MPLPAKLAALGLTPEKTSIEISGIVFEMCVTAAAVTAAELGFKSVSIDLFATVVRGGDGHQAWAHGRHQVRVRRGHLKCAEQERPLGTSGELLPVSSKARPGVS